MSERVIGIKELLGLRGISPERALVDLDYHVDGFRFINPVIPPFDHKTQKYNSDQSSNQHLVPSCPVNRIEPSDDPTCETPVTCRGTKICHKKGGVPDGVKR